MEEIVVGIISMLLIVALIPLYIWKRRQDSRDTHEHAEEAQVQQREHVVRATGARRMRRRPAAGASTSAAPTVNVEGAGTSSDEEAEENDDSESLRGKAARRREKKQREREAREAADAARDNRQTKQDRYEEMRRRKDEEREAQERLLEEEANKRKAKEEAEAALEFEKWKGEFSIDAEGTTENEVQDGGQGLLSNFVEYIQKHKCVPLEDLAAEFKLRTQDCINRIVSLESMGRLSGVMDDRGKYIYISEEEMKAVAEYIKREGRVSISHLASKSNQFIDLEPKSQFEESVNTEQGISVA